MSANTEVVRADASAVLAACRNRASGQAIAFENASEALLAYAGAFAAKDLDFIEDAVHANALIELPMLKPNRLSGIAEISAGHAEAFRNLAGASFSLGKPVEKHNVAIAEGVLTIDRSNGKQEVHPLGIVAATEHGKIQRVTLYFDARHFRRWSDKTIV